MAVLPRRLTTSLLALGLAGAGLTVGAPAGRAASAGVVVAEVFGGGGNSGAPYRQDFVELFNRRATTVELTGLRVHYWSTGGATPSATPLTGSIPPGGRYLVGLAVGANAAAATLPAPDATGTTAMSLSGGRVAVVGADGAIIDLLGWGGASTFEGAPAPATSNLTSVARADACLDTDNNAGDFVVGPPTPQNSTTVPTPCVDAPPPPPDPVETIAQIQGRAHLSPLAGQRVNGVAGVVTALAANAPRGFWMQSLTPDDDPDTSEGIYVFTSSAPTVRVGDRVSVDGTVTEFRPGGSGGVDNLTITEITGPRVTVVSSGHPLPAPVVIGVDRVAPAQTVDAEDWGTVEDWGDFRPDRDAIDFYESLEGMRTAVRDARVVGPTASFGEIPVVPAGTPATSSAGGVRYGSYGTPNAMRIHLDDALIAPTPMPRADVGDTLPGEVVGVLDYSFANYKLLVTRAPAVRPGGLQPEITGAQTNNQLAVATFNVENLSPSNPQAKFDGLAGQIVTNLRAPDIVVLEEIQDNSGPADDGTVSSSLTVQRLVEAIARAGGPAYQARWIDPQDKLDGGQPGGNIRQAFLYRPDRGVVFVDRPGGTATTAVQVVGTGSRTALSVSPGRIEPQDPAWRDSRKPLVGEFHFRGTTVFVVAVHFSSKGADDPLFGRWQQPSRHSETQRHAQAGVVRAFADRLLTADPRAALVVAGDVNDFEFSRTADILVGSGPTALTDLPRTLPAPERWTYVYEGNSQVLDHILVSPALTKAPPGAKYPAYVYDIVHTNAAFAVQQSDHDPQVVRLAIRGGTG